MKLRKLLAMVLTMAMVLTILPTATLVSAESTDSIVFTKELIPAGEGQPAKIKLEAYVKGTVSATSGGRPTDIIMILDQSGSMDDMIAVSDTESKSKLDIMKDSVQTFAEEVADLNTAGDNRYRVAIVGFASEDSNTEVLTINKSKSQIENNPEYTYYEINSSSMNTDENYYISTGGSYTEIYYLENYFWYDDGWYYGGTLDRTQINISDYTIYSRTATYPDYRDAFINCTQSAVAANGDITTAINRLDGNGATRADLGFEMAERIIEAQPEGTYDDRDKIIIFITDGVPTTASDFSSTVANSAVSYAKEMKDSKAHVYSLYLGTPTSNAESFMKAVSSNYPDATAYDSLGDAAANSYYAAAGNAAQITAVLEEIKYTITTETTLSEKSVITDEISEYFRLPVEISGGYDPTQITTYTVDKTANGWATEEKPFSTATVKIDGKTVSVEGFNFGYHCVTEDEKYPGGGDYGRKLVIYIPIVADTNNHNFGGYLPTNEDAGIFAEATDQVPVITADGAFSELEINYSMVATEKWYHLDGVNERTKTFSFEDVTVMGEILDTMIPSIPNSKNNAGVDMTYELIDTKETPGDRTDDVLVATLTVSAGEDVDVTDISNWTIESGQESVILDADGVDVKIYAINCKLESINPNENISKDVFALLSIGAIAPDVHIVGGEIDEGGKVSVDGTDHGYTYVEHVAEGNDSKKMVFSLESGYEFEKIRIDTNNHEGHMNSVYVYDIENNIGDDSIFTNGTYEYTAEDVAHGLAVVVETRPITYTLTTSKDEGSGITEGRTYTHHDTEKLTVIFGAYSGYEIDTLTVNGTTYNSVEEMENAGIVLSQKETSFASDGSTHTAARYGSIELPRTQDNEVSVTSKKRYYKVVFEEYLRGYENDAAVYSLHEATTPVYVEFGVALPSAPHAAGSEDVISTDNYTLSDWYNDYNGSVFYNVVDVDNATVPANDVTLHAFWEKNPSVVLGETVKIEKVADGAAGETFTFDAFIHEHLVGSVRITDSGEADMTITLTDRQNEQFENGEIIRIREVIPANDEWHYDTTVYNLTYGTNGNILKNGNSTVEKAVFTNIKNSYTVKYDLVGGLVDGDDVLDPKTVKWDEDNLFGIDDIPVKTGATFAGWKYETKEVKTSDTYGDLAEDKALKEITLVAQYETRSYTVKYDLKGGNISGATTIADKSVGYLDRDLLPTGTATKDGYTLVSWTYGDKVVTNTNTYASLANDHDISSITLVANWEVDEIGGNPDPEVTPDGIPDKYQKIVTYKIKGGTWDGVNNADIVEVVTLYDAQGNYSADGTATINVPDSTNFQKDAQHEDEGKGWTEPQPPANSIVSGTHPETFTYVFHKKPDVEYPKHEPDEPTPTTEVDEYEDQENILVDPNEGVWNYGGTNHTAPHKIKLTENIALGDADRDEHVFSGWVKSDPTNEQKALYGDDIVKVYTAQWDRDEIGGDPDPGETPDDIADKYQKKITFKIVNGKWDDGTTKDKVYVVDLLTTGNKYSVDGTADISGIIPVNMTANFGYKGGKWDVEPPTEVSGQDDVTYTYSYTRSSGGGGGGGNSTYVLTYESNGGTHFSDEKYSPGTVVELKKVPKKDGYIFDGWHADAELTVDVTEVTMTKNITVYAAWIEDNGAAGNGHDTPDSLNGDDHFAYVVGYPDGNVKPHNTITRAEVTTIFFRLLKDDVRGSNLAYTNAFSDADSDDWFNTAVSTMSKLGIVNGRKANKFDPNAYITRAEFAVICARFDNSEYVVSDEFTDVKGHWAEEEIHEAAAHGWIRGYENGTFRPDAYITRAEAMTMINRVLNRVPESDSDLLPDMIVWPDNSDKTAWYYLPVQEATNSHAFEMKNNIYERWTSIKEAKDWTQYE